MKTNTRLILPLICSLSFVSVHAATDYWDIDGATAGAGGATPSGTWDTGTTANWTTDSTGASAATTFADNDDAIFSAGSDATGTFTVDLSGTPIVGNVTVEEGNVTISGGTALNVGGGIASKGVLDAALNSTLTINSVVTGGDDSGTITKGIDGGTGYGTLVLNGANTYTGQTTLRVGTLSFDSIGDVNAGASALGNPADAALGTIKLGGTIIVYDVTLKYTGSGHNSDRVINLAGTDGTITLNGSGSGPVVFTSATGITVTGTGIHTLQFDGSNTAENTITGPIVDGNNYTKVAKFGVGTWVLLGDSTFSGVFDIRDGTVVINSIADQGSSSSIGTGSVNNQHAIIGFGSNTSGSSSNATLKYIGSGHSSNRQMRMYGTFGDPGGATIDASGTGALVLNGNILRPGAATSDTADKTLTLKGTNTDANALNGSIPDSNTAPGRTIVAKDGPGKWILGGANSYTGETIVKEGTLLVNGSLVAGSTVIVNSGAIFGGYGSVLGAATVAAGGTLSPGSPPDYPVITLSIAGGLTLAGNLAIELNKPFFDAFDVTGTLTNAGTGTVQVTNLGSALEVGDSFQLFNKALTNGEALTIVSADGVVWTNKLWLDGSIAVVAIGVTPPTVPATNLTISAVGPTSFSLGGKGAANSAYNIFASTNVTTPMSNWWLLGTTNSDGGGLIQFLDSQATNDQRFYRFGQTVTP